jgi:hypothetical protein
MDPSRRRLLQGVVAITVAGTTPIRWVTPLIAAPPAGAGPWFTRASYSSLVGSSFFVKPGTGPTASLRLDAVGDITALSAERDAAPDGRFSLLFTSASVFAQGTYLVRHPTLGSANLFVVPVGAKSARQRYEVVVNRLT